VTQPEVWLPIPEYAGLYEVSDYGRVRSLDRHVPWQGFKRFCRGVVLKPVPTLDGHLSVSLFKDGKMRNRLVHQLVLVAFIGPRPDGLISLHWDDDKRNNRLSNLRYGTYSENSRDAVRNGKNVQASQTHCIRNHEFTPSNTRMRPTGGRTCRECDRKRQRSRSTQKDGVRL
jgi:NUMOD4 motif/HNH endonuclease